MEASISSRLMDTLSTLMPIGIALDQYSRRASV
jgi:hypothetical protein